MNQQTENERFNLLVDHDGSFIHLQDGQSAVLTLNAPEFEIGGRTLPGSGWKLHHSADSRIMRNGGREQVFTFLHTYDDQLSLCLTLRSFSVSPFVRFRYLLSAAAPRLMTKTDGSDSICYTGLSLPQASRLTEIQVSQF